MPKLVWRVKLVAELRPGVTTETEVARVERGEDVGSADLGLGLLASKGHYPARFRSPFGEVPVRVRRWLVCSWHGPGEAKSFAALDLGKDAVAPELDYVALTQHRHWWRNRQPGDLTVVRAWVGGRG